MIGQRMIDTMKKEEDWPKKLDQVVLQTEIQELGNQLIAQGYQ